MSDDNKKPSLADQICAPARAFAEGVIEGNSSNKSFHPKTDIHWFKMEDSSDALNVKPKEPSQAQVEAAANALRQTFIKKLKDDCGIESKGFLLESYFDEAKAALIAASEVSG